MQKSLAQVVGQLRDMTLSQRLAIALGVVLVAGSLIWLAQWAASPELVPLLDQRLEPEELALVQGGLEALGQRYRTVGGRVLVPASARRAAILARLQQQNKLPADTSIGFGALVKESNPWISREESQRRWTVALQNELARVLAKFSRVKQASVHLPLGARPRGFARHVPGPSAAVTLTMQGGEPVTRRLALAAARLVAGAVPGLALKNVNVVDGNGVPVWPAPDAESGAGGELDRRRRQYELQIAEKIRSQLAFDPKVRVNVQVVLDRTARELESSTPTDPVEISVQRQSDETRRSRPGGQPGVQPNVGVAANSPSPNEISLQESSKVENLAGTTRKVEHTPPGQIQEVFAAVNVSHSYLEGVYRRNQPDGPPPTEAQIQQVFEAQKTRIVNQVAVLVKPQSRDQVRVDWYYDSLAVGNPPAKGALDSSLNLLQRFGPGSALALLALLALGLVMRMARRAETGEAFGIEIGLPREAIAAAKKAAEDIKQAAARPPRRSPAPGPAAAAAPVPGPASVIPMAMSEATVAEGVLEGQEVDESAVRTNNMLRQVASMVEQDAEGVAALVERWVQQKG